MRSKISIFTTTMGLFVALAAHGQSNRYAVTDLGLLPGGTFSYASHIANGGSVSGYASPADGTWHATLWQKGTLTDIGASGRNSVAFGVNDSGQVTGEGETVIQDPNGEDFCGFKALGLPALGNTCIPFVWQNGVMAALPTLGGPNGSASTINSQGATVGYAENTTRDPACPTPQVFQFKPVVWQNGKIQELPTRPGDPEGVAIGINDNGWVMGGSGSCAQFNPDSQFYLLGVHPLLWRNGVMTDLGNLGGTGTFGGNFACAANNLGQVVGQSDLPGDETTHGFIWQNGVMTDLGTIPGDLASFPSAINDAGQVVGGGLDPDFNLHAFIWQNGVMADLNTLIPVDSGLYLQLADSINATGQIVGFGMTSTGETHGYLATPQVLVVITGPGALLAQNTFQTILSSYGLSAAQSTSLNPGALSYSWTLSKGYPTAGILFGNTATPVIQFPTRGTYQLTLTVT